MSRAVPPIATSPAAVRLLEMSDIESEPALSPRVVGRYALFDEIAAGGMATVHLGRLVGQVGFSRTVAVKRLHPQYAKDQEFVTMFVDEARLASRIQHPNVVSTLDVVKTDEELFLVMEYVPGEALSRLVRNAAKRGERIPPNVVCGVMSGMLHGLHAAHEAKSETREPLNIVHRDISPQNVLVGVDGVARVLDFGVAKAAMRSGATRDGQMKGKLSYMSPEQLNGRDVDRRSDIFAAGIVLWEALAGKRLFAGADAGEILGKVLAAEIPTPASVVPSLPKPVSDVVMKALERDPEKRYQTARDFAIGLEQAGAVASAHNVSEWVKDYGGEELAKRQNVVLRVESHPMDRLSVTTDRPAGRRTRDSDELGSGSERTSGVLPPVDSDVSQEPERARQRRGIVTLTLVVLGTLAGVLIGKNMLFSDDQQAPTFASNPLSSVAAQLPSTDSLSGLQPEVPDSAEPLGSNEVDSDVDSEVKGAGSAPVPSSTVATLGAGGAEARLPEPEPVPSQPPPRVPPPYFKKPQPKVNCSPPWTVDPKTGIKKIKPGCMDQ